VAILLVCIFTLPAPGADRFWIGSGSSDNWSDEDNWSPDSPPQDGDTLIFGNVGARRSNNNDLPNLQVQSIVFNSSGYSLRGNTILLNSDITAAHTSGNNFVRLGVQFTHGGGSFNVVREGRLEVSGPVTLANNQSLIAFTLGTNLTISGAIVGDGGLTKLGEHALFLSGTPANTYTGPTYINGGTMYLDKPSGAQAISSRVSIGEDTSFLCRLADLKGGQYPPAMSMHIGPYARWGLTNGATVSSLTLDSGFIDGEGLLTLQCNVTNYGYSEIECSLYLGDQTRVFYVETDGGFARQLEVSGHILGPSGGANPSGIVKEGSGFLMLKNQNTFSGPMLINDGIVIAEHPQALGTATGETRVKFWGILEVGKNFSTTPMTISEPIVMEGGHLGGISPVTLNGAFTLSADSGVSGPWDSRLDLATSINGPGGLRVWGGLVRFSGPNANTFTGPLVVEPAFSPPEAVLELAKPNDVVAVPTAVTLQGFRTNVAVLRQFQDNGARDVTIRDGGVWQLNGFHATPNLLTFRGGGLVDTAHGALNFASLTVNTQLQVLPKLPTPSNYTARILGRIISSTPTNDLFIPAGITLDIGASITGNALLKRGPGKLVVGGDNRMLANIFAREGELVSTGSRALGTHTTVSDGATLWLESVFNFGKLTVQGRGFQNNGAIATTGLAIFSSNVVLSAATTLNTPTTNSILSILAPISGVGPLSKGGLGILIFGGDRANTFTGDTLVNEGTLELGKNDFAPAVPGDIVIGSGPPLHLPARVVYSGHDQIWNRITVNRGSLLDLNNRDEYSGDVTLNDGGSVHTGTGTLNLGTGVSLFVNRAVPTAASSISGRMALSPGSHRFFVGKADAGLDLNVTANIIEMSPSAGIVKDGPGSIGLRSANSFNGTLTINGGIVVATHEQAFGTAVGGTIVNNDAYIQLNGGFWVSEESLTLNTTNFFSIISFNSNAWSGNITLQRPANLAVPSGSGLVLSSFVECCNGIISGPGGITKTGSGTLHIAGLHPNTYTGPTIVKDGVIEAWRIRGAALPGDVFVTGNESVLRTGFSSANANTALVSSASVTLSNGALWKMNGGNGETIRALSGNGVLDMGGLSSGTSLTVDATDFCEFAGVVVGAGAIDKRGPAQWLLSGQSPFQSGAVTVSGGTLRVDGKIGGPVTVKGGAQLRGDGAVGNITAIEQDSVVQIDASNADHPGRQGGDLEALHLTVGGGGVAGFDIFGPSLTGGNDLLIAHGPVTLDNARLSAAFKYPPRDGDVVTLLRNNSPTPINGSFSGWPEGITRKLGDVNVRATYRGGDGNDFTLTVTNLALTYAGGPVFSGNGNETVESDECLLTHVFVRNRRDVPLTITNAFLRSLTPEVVVTVANSTYPPVPANNVMFNTAPFQFRTTPAFVCGTPIAFELEVGVIGEGMFAISFTVPGSTNCAKTGGGSCESCFTVSGQFSTNTSTLVRSHNFIGGPSLCFPPKRCPETNVFTDNIAVPYLTHSFTNSTTNELCVTAQLKFACPDVLTNALGAVAYLGTNDQHGPCVNFLGDTGADGTQPFSFRVPAMTNFLIVVSARATNVVCPDYTLELFGLPCPPPTLSIAKDTTPGKVLLQWSTAYPEFSLQKTNALAGQSPGAFTDIDPARTIVSGRYTVTNSLTAPKQFFRLSK